MDVLTHTVSGLAFGVAAAAVSRCSRRIKCMIVLAGGIGGFMPDIDAISLWSRFDAIFGRFFSLNHPGSYIYSAKFWYSHHGFMHSIAAGLLFSVIIAVAIFLYRRSVGNKGPYLAAAAFFSGYLIHLAEDMVTPGASWGGVRLFFPLEKYVGGFGFIWWWNNYDIFLIIFSAFFSGLCFLILGGFFRNSFIKIIPSVICLFAAFAVCFQISSRSYDFSYSGKAEKYWEMEDKSKDMQKDILGDKLYSLMSKFDGKLKIYF